MSFGCFGCGRFRCLFSVRLFLFRLHLRLDLDFGVGRLARVEEQLEEQDAHVPDTQHHHHALRHPDFRTHIRTLQVRVHVHVPNIQEQPQAARTRADWGSDPRGG